MIHVIGNSHSHYFSESTDIVAHSCMKTNQYFHTYSIGAAICYNFYENHLPIVKQLLVDEIKPKKDDYVMICGFHEIDCRWHLPKKMSEYNLTLEYVVDECLKRYFRTFVYLKNEGYNLIVFGSHPSTTSGHNDDYPNNRKRAHCKRISISLLFIVFRSR